VTLYQEVLEVSNPEDEDIMVFRNVGECQWTRRNFQEDCIFSKVAARTSSITFIIAH
jgi:hypothetical protein